MPASQQTGSKITAWLAEQQPAMLALLEALVNTDGGSYDKQGVDAAGEVLEAFFASHNLHTRRERSERYGDAIHIGSAAAANGTRPVLLMGHRDTVFPKGEALRRPFRIEGGRAYGPGVADMKAGLVMNAFVLAAFERFGGAAVAGLITGDEEIASPFSRPIIEATARNARCVFNSEPARPSGNVVTGRKGGVFMRCEVEGKAAHSGGNFEQGISAIAELAHKIVALHALTNLARGVTVNVGLVKGGQSINTTAPSAEAQIDLRFIRPEDRDAALAAIERISATSTVPGTRARLEIMGEFKPLTDTPGSRALFAVYQTAARELGIELAGEFTGGCADSGFTAAVGCPTLCAVGPVGGRAHSPEEYLEVGTIVPRAQTLALAILRLPEELG